MPDVPTLYTFQIYLNGHLLTTLPEKDEESALKHARLDGKIPNSTGKDDIIQVARVISFRTEDGKWVKMI